MGIFSHYASKKNACTVNSVSQRSKGRFWLKLVRKLAITSATLFALLTAAGAQTWTPLNNQPGVTLGAMLQLRDGRILVHEEQSGDSTAWHILTPVRLLFAPRNTCLWAASIEEFGTNKFNYLAEPRVARFLGNLGY